MKKKSISRKLPAELTTVTTTSRIVALTLFVILPILGFMIGIRYQKTLTEIGDLSRPMPAPEAPLSPLPTYDDNQVACTMDAKVCPDGSYVGRVAPTCDFSACPTN
jgi:hypothetical protein